MRSSQQIIGIYEKINIRHKNCFSSSHPIPNTIVPSQLCYGPKSGLHNHLTRSSAQKEYMKTTYKEDGHAFRSAFLLRRRLQHQRLEMLDFIPLCYWHTFLDMVFYLKYTHGMMDINNDLYYKQLGTGRE
jgi:hypothetical protein